MLEVCQRTFISIVAAGAEQGLQARWHLGQKRGLDRENKPVVSKTGSVLWITQTSPSPALVFTLSQENFPCGSVLPKTRSGSRGSRVSSKARPREPARGRRVSQEHATLGRCTWQGSERGEEGQLSPQAAGESRQSRQQQVTAAVFPTAAPASRPGPYGADGMTAVETSGKIFVDTKILSPCNLVPWLTRGSLCPSGIPRGLAAAPLAPSCRSLNPSGSASPPLGLGAPRGVCPSPQHSLGRRVPAGGGQGQSIPQ
ncbi:PREDICTED: uncharacterized protein LOC101805794 [Ficedula albicollis]|uniref:uncharacterized protein LOC101805794 n=1 Tax=Ficedula albicollis TaxID=59894 RepID=UPI0003598EA9|nr:PREDICTED: uncharacterized protein LOC101805794 [Ficedula albicollis]